MASALKLLKGGQRDFDLNVKGAAGVAVHTVVESGIEYGAGFGIGQIYHRYGETSKLAAQAPRIAGIVGKLGGLLIHMGTKGQPHIAAGLLNSIGSAGVAACGVEHGLRSARAATGQQAVLLPKGATVPANAKVITHIGELPPAPPGVKPMGWEQIYELAAMH